MQNYILREYLPVETQNTSPTDPPKRRSNLAIPAPTAQTPEAPSAPAPATIAQILGPEPALRPAPRLTLFVGLDVHNDSTCLPAGRLPSVWPPPIPPKCAVTV